MRYIIIGIFLLAAPFCALGAEETITIRSLFPAPGGVINTTENANLAVGDTKKVGIGTDTPQSKLDVEGGVAIGEGYAGSKTAPDNGLIVEGRVGIGTPAPLGELCIYGLSDAPGIIFGERNASVEGPYGCLRYENSYGYIELYGQDNDHHYLDIILETGQHGNVGIGDSSPDARLEVTASGLGDNVFMLSSDDDTDGDLLIVKENGDVGIGAKDPDSKLEVRGGAIRATGGLIIETRRDDPAYPVNGQIWLRTDL